NIKSIKNFCIISHVDHGKSTLADRFLEVTRSINERDMEEQFLDQMELERERGITVKMAPVRMIYKPSKAESSEFILNLIDTPGHSDFSYEVSRALAAVEGAILLVDGSQGVQAQTVANYRVAKEMGLTVIGAVNKIDLFSDEYDKKLDDERLEETVEELDALLEEDSEIHKISALKGEGVERLLDDICRRFPSPDEGSKNFSRALIFDSFYDRHKGVVAGVRVYDGVFESDEEFCLMAVDEVFRPKEVGFFEPEMSKRKVLETGEIGYIATGLKEPKDVRIGDTVTKNKNKSNSQEIEPLPGYKEPDAQVFVSFYPESGDNYDELGKALEKLRLNDSALTIEGDRNEILGRGYKVGFLGKLHYEITNQRLEEEFGIRTINTLPSVRYKIKTKDGDFKEISRPEKLPDNFEEIYEPK
ncbi:MAG: GTP-binding protein, partial [Candidatus Magasanikbacteria bacterium]